MFGRLFKKKAVESSAAGSAAKAAVSSPGELRKEQTEKRLQALGVPVNAWLPLFVDDTVIPRSGSAVRQRMLCLALVAAYAEGLSAVRTKEVLTNLGLLGSFTPNESRFLNEPSPNDHVKAQFVWQYECAWALQWAMGLTPELGDHTSTCRADEVSRLALVAAQDASLAPIDKERLLVMGDELYRLHWACRDAQLKGLPSPAGLIADVVWERRRAIQWLLEPDVEWDDLSLDT